MLLPRFSVPNINTRIDYDSQNKFHLDIYIYYFVTRLKLLHKREVKVFLAFPCLGVRCVVGTKTAGAETNPGEINRGINLDVFNR